MGEGAYRQMENSRRIVFIGAGNVATHLAKALSHKATIVQVISHRLENARTLAEAVSSGCLFSDSVANISKADVYIVSVKDDAIASILASVPEYAKDALWVHTSGSVSVSVFQGFNEKYGVLYPMQTFSKDVQLDISEIPFFIEGCNKNVENEIETIALLLSQSVYRSNSKLRQQIHIAAVFSCNFTNHMFSIAEDILAKEGIPFSVMLPLIKETVRKVSVVSPKAAQTGPASRGDSAIVSKHLESLPELNSRKIYEILSQSIMNQSKK